jgi:hypothetical protein
MGLNVTRIKCWWMTFVLAGLIVFISGTVMAERVTRCIPPARNITDTITSSRPDSSGTLHLNHQIGVEIHPEHIFQTNSFLKGQNRNGKPYRRYTATHLKYSFQFDPNSATAQIFGKPYQGVGFSWFTFGNKEDLGKPLAFYLFQGAQISSIVPGLSLNYEWNFGLSFGWNPFNKVSNPYNTMIGSELNAYINAGLYLNWVLSPKFDLTTGVTVTHFSNGNTQYPNAGLNATGLKLGVVYNFNRKISPPETELATAPAFPRHVSYDLILYGSWRRKGVQAGDEKILVPHAFRVLGFSFAPMYNLGYQFRAGLSIDGVYDHSANVYAQEVTPKDSRQVWWFRTSQSSSTYTFMTPSFDRQWSVGISGRVEFVMPYFSINLGAGMNVLNNVGDLKSYYQVLALKISVTRSSFIHIGYNLKDFKEPNYLMLGVGFRFHNKYPHIHR